MVKKRLRSLIMLKSKLLLLASCSFFLFSCSTSERYASKSNDEYIYVIDYKKVNAVERAMVASSGNVKAVWVNPPIKRMKKSEYIANQK